MTTDDLNPLQQKDLEQLHRTIAAYFDGDIDDGAVQGLAEHLFLLAYRKLVDEPDPGRRHRLAKLATVDLNTWVVTFDGDPFPYYMAQEGVDVEGLGDPNGIPVVRFGVLAETVHVIPKEPKP